MTTMTRRRLVLALLLAIVAFPASFAGRATAQNTLVAIDAYGTFHAGGVVATVSGDPDGDAAAALEWRVVGEPAYHPGHPLARLPQPPNTFAGSLFWLTPGTSYEVRVTATDPDGTTGITQRTTTFSTRPAALPEPTVRTLYVAPNGNDGGSNPGTNPAMPLLTVQRAAQLSIAGTLVSIAPGIYREAVTVPTSGTAVDPIVFRGSAPGVILDGADATIDAGGGWTAESGGVYSRAIAFPTGHVVSDAGRLYRYGSLSTLTALAAGEPGGFWYDSGGGRLYVKLVIGGSGASPNAHAMHVARLDAGFTIDTKSYVRVENVEIRHYGTDLYGKGVYLRFATECAVRGSRIHDIEAAGVWLKGGTRNLVEDNDLTDTSIFGWPWNSTKGSTAENNGVTMTDDVGRGNVIRGNRFRGTFNGIGPCGGSQPPGGVVTSETDVYDNDFRQHTDDALEPEGWCSNVRMWGNTIRDAHMAFAVAPAHPGPTFILRNVAYNFGNTRTSIVDGFIASALKINVGDPNPVGPLFLYHNTLLTVVPDTDAVALLNPGGSTYITAGNNVIAGTRYALYKVNPVTLDWNWNDLYTTAMGGGSPRYVSWMGTAYTTPAAFRAATGLETNGIATAPLLEDAPGGLFMPQAGSPLIDRGRAMPGINEGFRGTAPDIGAIEWAWLRDGFESGNFARWSAATP